MATAQATLNNLRQSPRKVRLVADFMRGKSAVDALASLQYMDKKASEPMIKLLRSALANARDLSIEERDLFIQTITVDGGQVLHRRRPTARGRAFPIRKKTSKVILVLGEKVSKTKLVKSKQSKLNDKNEQK